MGTTVNNNSTTTINNFNITINNTVVSAGGADSVNRTLNLFNSVNDRLETSRGTGDHALCPPGTIPEAGLTQAGVPAGKGLTTNPEGWPDGTVETAGGYRIVAEGNTNWSVYAPGQKPGDTAHTRVWGDPHVAEKDGTKWDFTKDSDFVLPDGTRIFADTDYDASKGNGQSVTKRLVIANGQDRIEVDGVDKGKPTLGPITNDAYEWRALHLTNPQANGSSKYGQSEGQHDAFHLRGDQNNVHWMRERNGQLDGVVTGTKSQNAGNHNIYDQTIDPTINPTIARELRPPIGSRAWGNQIRSQLNDAEAKNLRQVFGKDYGALFALGNSYGNHADHINGEFQSDALDWLFGGLPGAFNDYITPFNALRDMVSLLRADSDWRNQFRYSQYDTHLV
jgi:hypothetical protein